MDNQENRIQVENDKIYLAQFAPKRNFSVPNVISALRIVMIPFILVAYFKGHTLLASALVVISALSDGVDGYIARHYDQITTLGKVLDPAADKLTQFAIGVCLCFSYPEVIPLALILAGKELTMLFWGIRLLKRGLQPISARWWGKVSTVLFYLGALIIIAFSDTITDRQVAMICGVIVVALLFSLLRYGLLFHKKARQLADNSVKTS